VGNGHPGAGGNWLGDPLRDPLLRSDRQDLQVYIAALMEPTRLTLCFGTRPQVIKASVLLAALRARWPVTALDTGQHYDFELNGLLYRQLGVPLPDHFLGVGSGEPAEQIAGILTRTAELLRRQRPAAVVVIGDTNSTLGSALAACKERVPLVHVEAGLRATEADLPEEANRRVVDVLAHALCAPSQSAAARLTAEGVHGSITTTGDVARDVLIRHLQLAPAPVARGPFALATLHRAALTSDREALRSVLEALGELAMPVIFPAHPRTHQALERFGLMPLVPRSVSLTPPIGYLESIAAVRDADVVVTDSGGLQREAYWLGTPCVTLRTETEWRETVECGANALVSPLEAPGTLGGVVAEQQRRRKEGAWTPDAYGDGRAADRIVAAIACLLDSR
jgi:UDP-GlcNAc3NAcA epimerase